MNPTLRSQPGPRVYDDFVPHSDLIQEEGLDTILMELPGFRKENLKVQLHSNRKLRTSGERHLDGNQWERFRKDFHLSEDCNESKIRAKFENGVLTISLPKLKRSAASAPQDGAQPSTPLPPPPPPPPPVKPQKTTSALPTAQAPAETPAMLKPSKTKESADSGDIEEVKEAVSSGRKF